MKVSRIVKQTKEYERLQGLIDNIRTAIKNLEKQETPFASGGTINYSWNGTITLDSGYTGMPPVVSITLNSGVSELICASFKGLLRFHLAELKAKQSTLEV